MKTRFLTLLTLLPLIFTSVSCGEPNDDSKYYREDFYFSVYVAETAEQVTSLYRGVTYELNTDHRGLLYKKISFEITGSSNYEFYAKEKYLDSVINYFVYYLTIKDDVNSIDIKMTYFDLSKSQSFTVTKNEFYNRMIVKSNNQVGALYTTDLHHYQSFEEFDSDAKEYYLTRYDVSESFFENYDLVIAVLSKSSYSKIDYHNAINYNETIYFQFNLYTSISPNRSSGHYLFYLSIRKAGDTKLDSSFVYINNQ